MWDRLPSNRRSAIETCRGCEIIPTSKSVTDKQANKMFGLVCNRGFLITEEEEDCEGKRERIDDNDGEKKSMIFDRKMLT